MGQEHINPKASSVTSYLSDNKEKQKKKTQEESENNSNTPKKYKRKKITFWTSRNYNREMKEISKLHYISHTLYPRMCLFKDPGRDSKPGRERTRHILRIRPH